MQQTPEVRCFSESVQVEVKEFVFWDEVAVESERVAVINGFKVQYLNDHVAEDIIKLIFL